MDYQYLGLPSNTNILYLRFHCHVEADFFICKVKGKKTSSHTVNECKGRELKVMKEKVREKKKGRTV